MREVSYVMTRASPLRSWRQKSPIVGKSITFVQHIENGGFCKVIYYYLLLSMAIIKPFLPLYVMYVTTRRRLSRGLRPVIHACQV